MCEAVKQWCIQTERWKEEGVRLCEKEQTEVARKKKKNKRWMSPVS